MIISKCPLRVSLIGGSTDLQPFLDKYEWGGVVSFPINLYTYIHLKNRKNKYKISYSSTEVTNSISEIKNDIAREVLSYFNCPPVEISFTADIPSHGSGLASSSSYMIGLIAAVSEYVKSDISRQEMCDIAIKLERKFNKLTGYQDPYGCGIGGIKKMIFNKNGNTTIQYLDNSLFRDYDLYLIPTNKIRTSTDILSSINMDAVYPIRNLLEQCDSIISSNVVNLLNESWKLKKESSKSIIDKELESIESKITELKLVKGYKLCGAGGGGYFLIITEKGVDISNYFDNIIKITVDKNGVETDYL